MKIYAFALSAAALAGAVPAEAALFTQTYDVVATDFAVSTGNGSVPLPADPVHINFSVTFDDAVSFGNQLAGLTVHANNLPYAFSYGFETSSATLVLATSFIGNGPGCSSTANGFCLFIHNALSASPTITYFNVAPSSGSWIALSTTVTAGPDVPEPASWALMISGFGLVGAAMRRRPTKMAFA